MKKTIIAKRVTLIVLMIVVSVVSVQKVTYAESISFYEELARTAIDNLPSEITLEDRDVVFEARRLANDALRRGGLPHFIGNFDVLESKESVLRTIIKETYRSESLLDLTPTAWLESDLSEMSERFAAYDDPESWSTGGTVNGQNFGGLLVYSRGHRDLDQQPQWIEYDISDKPYKYLEGYVGVIDTSSAISFPPSFVIYGEIDGEMQILFFIEELYRDEPAYHYFIDVSNVDKVRFYMESETVSGNRWTNRLAIVEPVFHIID